jgi:hypothetical protein
MNPMLRDLLASVFRYLLGYAGMWLVAKGVITSAQSDAYINEFSVGLTVAVAAVAAGLWARFKSRQKLVTAMASPFAMTEADVTRRVAHGLASSVTTPTDEVPL